MYIQYCSFLYCSILHYHIYSNNIIFRAEYKMKTAFGASSKCVWNIFICFMLQHKRTSNVHVWEKSLIELFPVNCASALSLSKSVIVWTLEHVWRPVVSDLPPHVPRAQGLGDQCFATNGRKAKIKQKKSNIAIIRHSLNDKQKFFSFRISSNFSYNHSCTVYVVVFCGDLFTSFYYINVIDVAFPKM